MSWGIKIAIVYVGFMALIISMVIVSSSSKSELVAKDYYAQELNYQQRIDAINNEKGLASSITHEMKDKMFVLHFPKDIISQDAHGEIVFFRPSDSTKDVKVKLDMNENGEQFVSTSNFVKGVYKICISWHSNDKDFYKEEVVNF